MAAENFDLEVIDLDDGPLLDDKEPLISDGNGRIPRQIQNSNNKDRKNLCFCSCDVNESSGIALPYKVRSFFTKQSCAKSASKCFPSVRMMINYKWRKNILSDVVAGLTVGIMNIPQGMAYAILAELDPVVGLYVSFFAPLLYFIFGTSLQMSVGTFALASLMLADPVSRLAGDKADADLLQGMNMTLETSNLNASYHEIMANLRWEVALSVSLLVGLMQIGMGILHLGFLAVFLSDALVSGFTTGAAFHVFTSQLPAVFGVKIPRHTGAYRLIKTYAALIVALSHTNLITLCVSVVSMIILILVRIFINPMVMRKIKFPIPIELILVVIGTVVSYSLSLNYDWSVQIIGKIPSGFPTPRLPRFHIMSQVVLDALTIAFFLFACTVSLAKIFSRKHRYSLDANQEAFALGLTNTIIPFFGAYLAAGSLSRSMVQDEMGGKSQLAGLISSVLILVVLLAIGPLFSSVPNCILSCIILISLKGLFKQFSELPRLWRTSKYDFAIWLITFLCTLLLDVGIGLLAGIAFSLLTVVARAHSLSAKLVSDIPQELQNQTPQGSPLRISPGTRVIRLDGPLYFGSAEKLRSYTLSMSRLKGGLQNGSLSLPLNDLSIREQSEETEVTRRIILDCRHVTFIDSTGLRIVEELAQDLDLIGIEVTIVDSEKQFFVGLNSSRHENITISLSFEESLRAAGRHFDMNGADVRETPRDVCSTDAVITTCQSPTVAVSQKTCINGQLNQENFDVIT